jgi:penicillin V acylase-like amidase (Ntn superfamily)
MNKTHKIFYLLFTAALCFPLSNSASACTSVCLTKNGHVVFGNNLDWFIDDGMVVINKRNAKKRGLWFENPPEWTSKYASVTTNLTGNGFPTRGMNETGLVVGEMWLGRTVYPDRDSRHPIATDQWMQYQLDNCATVEEVLATDKILRIDKDEYKSHFFISTRSPAEKHSAESGLRCEKSSPILFHGPQPGNPQRMPR